MIRFYSLLLVLFVLRTVAQTTHASRIPFVNYQANKLVFGRDSAAFMDLFRKMDELRDGKRSRITVAQIGGSHIQAGVWSGEFVTRLQNDLLLKGGGHFAFPYKIARTNGQSCLNSFSTGSWKRCRAISQEFCLPLGMSGISAGTNDTLASFGIKVSDKALSPYVDMIRVYHNFNPSFVFELQSIENIKSSRDDKQEQGYTEFRFDPAVDSVSFTLKRIDTLQKDFVLLGFSIENTSIPGYYLAALGVNGASSSSFLRWPEWSQQLSTISPDLYILSLGVNDVQASSFDPQAFAANYDSLINVIRKASPDAAILLTTVTDNYIRRKTPNRRTARAGDALLELRQRRRVAVWDLYTVMGGYRSINKWILAGYARKDRIHFTPKGYVLLGDLMYESLMKAYANYRNGS